MTAVVAEVLIVRIEIGGFGLPDGEYFSSSYGSEGPAVQPTKGSELQKFTVLPHHRALRARRSERGHAADHAGIANCAGLAEGPAGRCSKINHFVMSSVSWPAFALLLSREANRQCEQNTYG